MPSEALVRWTQEKVIEIENNPSITINQLWAKYNELIEDATFPNAKEYIAALKKFAKSYLPWIQFNIKKIRDWYNFTATSNNTNDSIKSIELLEEWLSTWIAISIKTKLRIIASQYDSKTGIYNHSMVGKFWNIHKSSLIIFDINEFKKINDTKWYTAWDKLLRQFAKILKSEIVTLKEAQIIRNWWDEFIIILQNTSIQDIREYIKRVHYAFNQTPWSYWTSCWYFYRKSDEENEIDFDLACNLADHEMKLRKWLAWTVYRLKQGVIWLPDDEKIALIRELINNLTPDQIQVLQEKNDVNKS